MDPLREAAQRDGMGPAVEGTGAGRGPDGAPRAVSWCWAELDRKADRVALRLAEAGVGPGQAVAMLLPPSPEAVLLLHAVPRVGAIVVPLHPGRPIPELRRALSAVGRPRLLLAPGEKVDALRQQWPEVASVAVEEVAPVGGSPGDVHDPDPADPTLRRALPEPVADTPVAVLLTSGSTGSPRAVPLTHGNLTASAQGAAQRLRLDPLDVWLATLSPAHVGGLALMHRAAVVGCPVLTRPRFDAQEFLELADQGAFTHASVVPTMLLHLLELRGDDAAPRGLRCLLVGGARTPTELLGRALVRRWPVALTYGLTEATSQVATAPPELVRRKPGTVGPPLPGVGVALGERDASGTGEILVRGPTVALLPPGNRTPSVRMDAAGWLHTGDLGRLDEDGDLWITGRLSDRIVSGGVTVDPAEVEEVLGGHPAVGEVAVVGLSDPEWGERVVAALTARDPGHPPMAAELDAWCRERLGPGKRPRTFRILEGFPRNPNGKVDRRALRSLLAE
jgi:o-succinylbenzoate---CoA ligase